MPGGVVCAPPEPPLVHPWTMSRAARGGAWLRRVRREEGLTQGALSDRSGVSVRTIRGLERGEILTPQIATLQQIAVALGLTPQEQTEFMHAWATERLITFEELLDPGLSELEQIDALTRLSLGTYRVISQVWRTSVAANRRITRTGCQTSIAAVEDGLERVFSVQCGDETTCAADMRFVPLLGCTLLGRQDFPDSNVVVFEVGLPRRLAKGEMHAYAYQIIDEVAPDADLGDSDGFVWGPPHTARSVVVSVEFEVPPAAITRVECPPGGQLVLGGAVTLDDDLRASIVLEDAGPGAFGFTWQW